MSTKFVEVVVKNFSGPSSETKPTLAAGNNIPNGSRWREVDTGSVYHFDSSTDTWYESDKHIEPVAGASSVVDLRSLELLEQILTELKKIEYHLFTATDTDLTDTTHKQKRCLL